MLPGYFAEMAVVSVEISILGMLSFESGCHKDFQESTDCNMHACSYCECN